MRRAIVIVLSVVLALVVATPIASGQVEKGSAKTPPAEKLASAWWQWALNNPAETSPLVGDYSGGEQCDGTNPTGTWFLAAEFENQENATTGGIDFTAERTCTAVPKKQLFWPVFNNICGPLFGDDPNDSRWAGEGFPGCAKWYMDRTLSKYNATATVDGKPVEIKRVASGDFSLKFDDANNFLGASPGNYPAATDGLWVLLPALSPGNHTVHWEGDFTNPFTQPPTKPTKPGYFHVDVTYNLTVE